MTAYDPSLEDTLGRAPRGQYGSPDPTLAVVVARLDDLRESMTELRAEVRSSTANVVPRGEWVQRNQHVDGKFDSQGKEISHLRAEVASRRTSVPVVIGSCTGALSLIVVLIQNIQG